MSVTIEIDKVAHYFQHVINEKIVPAFEFQIDDQLFYVQDMYLEHIQNYGLYHTKNLPIKRATILAFLSGLLEIQTVHETLRFPRGKPDSAKFNLNDDDECIKFNYDVVPLHSDLAMDIQMNIFTPAKNTFRK
ncbi:unnamed protein product, partial [Rotaria sp. Silwood2]